MAKWHSFMDRIYMVSYAIKSALVAPYAIVCSFYCRSLRVFTEGFTINNIKTKQNQTLNYMQHMQSGKKGPSPDYLLHRFPHLTILERME